MAEELKGLIEKIREEGIKVAEEKAKEIEAKALGDAGNIIENAKKEARKIIEEARKRESEFETTGKAALKQGGRDLLISLKKEISAMLDKIVATQVHKALDPGELARIITVVAKEQSRHAGSDIIITLKKEDLEKLEKGFLSILRDETKKGVTLKASDEIQAGFLISYDSGKSYYDFTDKSLAAYISLALRPKLAEILNEAV